MKPIAYEGKEPYIFISYAHKDSERVFQVLNELDLKGYRIWYDDGIAPGSEWPEDIARHLDAAHMVIAFITDNSMASQNCRREINFALSKEKHFLSILLERVNMPLGMEMQLSAQQSILRYNYETWQGFIDKILKCPDIVPCQRPQVLEPVIPVSTSQARPVETAAPLAQPVTAQTVITQPAATQSNAIQPAAVSPAPVKKIKPAKAPKQPKLSKPKEVSTGKAKRNLILFGSIGIVTILLSVLAIALLKNTSFKTSWGDKVNKNETSIFLINKTITQEDLKRYSSLKKLKSFNMENCDLSNCDFSAISFSPTLKIFTVKNCGSITNFQFLKDLTLSTLILNGQDKFSDLSSINVTALEELSLSGTSVSELSSLENAAALRKLTISNTEVTDLSPLSSLTKLTHINAEASQVASLSPIVSSESLTDLNISYCPITDLPSELMTINLVAFQGSGIGLGSLSLLKNCSRLVTLDVSDNPLLSSFDAVIDQNMETLVNVNISRTGFSEEELGSLSSCIKIKDLRISGIFTKDLSFCKSMENLEVIHAEGCGIEDISGLVDHMKLEQILLSFNQISDISPLSSIIPVSNILLDLSFNPLKDISSLAQGKYKYLFLHGCDASVSQTLSTAVSAYMITLPYEEDVTESALASKGSYYQVYLTDCPANQILNVQDTLGKGYVTLISLEELMTLLYENQNLTYALPVDYSYPYQLYQNQ